VKGKPMSTGVSVGVYHSFKDISIMTKVSGQTASQKLDHNEDRSKEKEKVLQHVN